MGRKQLEKTESRFKQVIDKYGISGAKIAVHLGIPQALFARKVGKYSHSFTPDEEKKIVKYLSSMKKDLGKLVLVE